MDASVGDLTDAAEADLAAEEEEEKFAYYQTLTERECVDEDEEADGLELNLPSTSTAEDSTRRTGFACSFEDDGWAQASPEAIDGYSSGIQADANSAWDAFGEFVSSEATCASTDDAQVSSATSTTSVPLTPDEVCRPRVCQLHYEKTTHSLYLHSHHRCGSHACRSTSSRAQWPLSTLHLPLGCVRCNRCSGSARCRRRWRLWRALRAVLTGRTARAWKALVRARAQRQRSRQMAGCPPGDPPARWMRSGLRRCTSVHRTLAGSSRVRRYWPRHRLPRRRCRLVRSRRKRSHTASRTASPVCRRQSG